MAPFKLVKLADYAHLLPANSHWQREIRRPEQRDRIWASLHEGDLTIDVLNLDLLEDLHPGLPTDNDVSVVIVTGNLTVREYIYNENTDGAMSLIVQGNLHAKNMLVGGQDITVSGNLHVDELFWGDYNHGEVTIAGNAQALVFIATDYSVYTRGQLAAKFGYADRLPESECNWQELNCNALLQILDPVLLLEDSDSEDDIQSMLSRGTDVLAHLQAGKRLIHPNFSGVFEPPPPVSFAALLELATVEKITEILALPVVKEEYNDYYDPDKNGFDCGNYHHSFRQAGESDDGIPRVGSSVEIENDSDDYDCDFYQFDIEQDSAGNAHVVPKYQANNGYECEPEAFGPADSEHIQRAYKRFSALVRDTYKANAAHLETAQELASLEQERLRKKITQAPPTRPVVTVCGVEFKVITQSEAENYVGNLLWGPEGTEPKQAVTPFQLDEDGYFLLAQSDVQCEQFDMSVEHHPQDIAVAGFIFAKHLSVKGAVLSADMDTSPYFVVLGNCTARAMALSGNTHFVQGDLVCELIYGNYNHGFLFVCGSTRTTALLADDFYMYLSALNSWIIVGADYRVEQIYGADLQGTSTTHRIPCASTHDLTAVLSDHILAQAEDEGGFGNYYLPILRAIADGKAVVDIEKAHRDLAAVRKTLLQDVLRVFKHPYFRDNSVLSIELEDDDENYCRYYRSDKLDCYSISLVRGRPLYSKFKVFIDVQKKLLRTTYDIDLKNTYLERNAETERLTLVSKLDDQNYSAAQVIYAARNVLAKFKEWAEDQ